MPIARTKLKTTLLGKFRFVSVAKTRHDAVALFVGEKQMAYTQFSSTWDTIDDGMLTTIAGQLNVSLHQLKQMHGCTLSRDWYLGHLK